MSAGIYNIKNMSGLAKALVDLLIPDANRYYGNLVFEAAIVELNGGNALKFRLTTIYRDWDYDKKYIKSRSQMNVSIFRKVVKEALGLGPKELVYSTMDKTSHSDYNSSWMREAELKYIITDELVDKLIALEAMVTKGGVHV